ncbi:MAG: hypothetical protein M3179_01550 [Actinomycetota bacterium]|nr:hypothetical protein [Actinomycetota bacterium]
MHDNALRPVERRVLRLAGDGVDDAEIARRFRHSEDWVARVRAMAELPRTRSPVQGDVLRPVERRVLRWRANGVGYDELSPRFRRSPKFLEQVESLARYKLRGPA